MKQFLFLSFLIFTGLSNAQYTHDDTLRGSITPEREWWNLLHYELKVKVIPAEKEIIGSNTIRFQALSAGRVVQIDLQPPLQIDSVVSDGQRLQYNAAGTNAHFIHFPSPVRPGERKELTVYYSGIPREAVRAPWDGGVVWTKDSNGNPFIATACQGLGASSWWPCKDHMYDEPEQGIRISVNTPENVMNVSNGRLLENILEGDGTRTTVWNVVSPINNYGVNMNIGDYAHWSNEYAGKNGTLTMDYYVLKDHLEKARTQFADALRTMEAFEHWFGPYPFYEDGYKLVEVPYLGMEHQSSVTYGNQFKNGYLGTDLSGTGWGLKWDYIIVHESGHEWFANNITHKDAADMWIHESFTTYSEGLFVEYFYGKEAGAEYLRGLRKGIINDRPLIGVYDVNKEGSGDMYPKGANVLHTLRQVINNDEKWHAILLGLNKTFYHQTVSSEEIEAYIADQCGLDLTSFFNQYLRTKDIPVLHIEKNRKECTYWWSNTVEGFNMPIDVLVDGKSVRIIPTQEPQRIRAKSLEVNPDFYIRTKRQ